MNVINSEYVSRIVEQASDQIQDPDAQFDLKDLQKMRRLVRSVEIHFAHVEEKITTLSLLLEKPKRIK